MANSKSIKFTVPTCRNRNMIFFNLVLRPFQDYFGSYETGQAGFSRFRPPTDWPVSIYLNFGTLTKSTLKRIPLIPSKYFISAFTSSGNNNGLYLVAYCQFLDTIIGCYQIFLLNRKSQEISFLWPRKIVLSQFKT